ncbi:MAG: DMT family transporter [Candidatus Sungbacteria bacterium]|uniref:DMT family transporter n=1 Tax=Candidatus Sungiibacteriota bacterium TaxID=2750080 RepID=A0A931SAR0_9BACT|nr:DMT family transporter [Candidatus Sungbacteria bacterium]
MNESWPLLAFVLTGTFLWGIGNVVKSYFLRKRNVHEDVVVVATMFGAAAFSFTVEVAVNGLPGIREGFWIPFAVTAVLNIGIQYWNVKALKYEDASIVVPLASSMPLFLILMAWVILREFPTPLGRVGIVCIALGAYVLYLKGTEMELPGFVARMLPEQYHARAIFWAGPWLRLWSSKGARLALATAYLGAIAVPFDKLATLRSSPMVFTGGAFLVVAAFVYGWSHQSGRWQAADRSNFMPLFYLGLLVGLYTVLMNAGYLYGIAPYVGALKRVQIFWTVLLAGLFLKESHTRLRLTGASIIFAGALLISLG